MEIIKRLRSVAKIVLTRLELHGQLASVEWAEERHRLLQLLAFSLLGFIFLTESAWWRCVENVALHQPMHPIAQ